MIHNKQRRCFKTLIMHSGIPERHQGRIWTTRRWEITLAVNERTRWRFLGKGWASLEEMIRYIKSLP